MPEDKNGKGPLFDLDFSQQSNTVSSTENLQPTSISTLISQVTQSDNPLFDLDLSSPKVKKKDQPEQKEVSPLPLVGSTSESAGSLSATSQGVSIIEPPKTTEEKFREGVNLVNSLFGGVQIPKPQETRSPEELALRNNQRVAIDKVLRQAAITNPDILEMPGIEDAINNKVRDITGEDDFFDTQRFLKEASRSKSLLESESAGPLDVTPDFNTNQIFNNIQKASADLKKNELLAQGKSEEEADASVKLLFPDREVGKSVEMGININKVKDDYLSFLAKNNPEKIRDINAAKAVDNFEGERSLKFMEEALQHQAEIINIKINNLASKGQENLTEQDVKQMEQWEGQLERLGKRYRNLIFEYPEIRDKVFKEKAAQKAVDESYKRAKAKAILPGWDGTKAQAEVLYHQVISPIGATSVDMVGNILKLGVNQLQGMSNDEVSQGTAGIISDWANSFFDTEKSSSIYKKPSELKGSVYENGELQAEKIVPKISETLFQMYGLLAGGSSAGGALEKLGLAAKASQNIGLVTSSYVLSQNDYFEEAKALGLSDREANNFANSSALVTSLLELVNPQRHIFGKEAKRSFTKGVVKMVNEGADMKDAIKFNSKFIGKELLGENAQEGLQMLGDLGTKYVFNKKNEDDVFDVSVTQDEIKEMVLLTSIVSGIGTTPGVKSKSSLETESLFRATQDIDKFKQFMSKPETQERFSEEQIKQVTEKVEEYKKVVDGLPKELSTDKKIELANLVYNKKKLNESKSEVFTDDVVKSKAGDNIETQINEINGQIELIFDEDTETTLDKPVAELKIDDKGSVEYKIDDKFYSQEEIIQQLGNEEFTKSVRDGEVNLNISNPSPEVALALRSSGLLTNSQLETIKSITDVKIKQEETETPETKVLKGEQPTTQEVDTTEATKQPKVEEAVAVEIPQTKIDKLTELDFNEEAIGNLSEQQIDNIIADEIKFTEDLDLEKVGVPIVGEAKITEGFEELTGTIPEEGAPANVFNPPAAFNALKKITEGVVEETGLQGKKLITELKSRLSDQLGDNYNEADINDVSEEIIEFAKGIEKIEQVQEKPELKPEGKQTEAPKEPKTKTPEKKQKPEKEGQKRSGFQERTLETAEGSPAKEQVKRVVEENKQFYKVMNIQGTVEEASKRIEDDGGFEQAYDRLISDDVGGADNWAILQVERQIALDFYGEQLDLAVRDGRKADADKAYNRVKNLQDAISELGTKAGQSIAALQVWKALRPDGTVEFMNRRLNDYNKNRLNKKNPKTKNTYAQDFDNFQEFVKNITEEQINEVLKSDKGKAIIDKILAKSQGRVKNELQEKIRRRKAKVDSVVKRLDSLKFSSQGKAYALPAGINLIPVVWDGSIEVIKKSIQAGESMATAIDKAVDYIKSKVGDEDFGESAYRSQFAEERKSLDTDKEVQKEIDKALKDLGLSINDVIKKHYTEKDKLARTLSEKLIEDSGLTPEEAKTLSGVIESEFKSKVQRKAQDELSKTIGVSRIPVKREVKRLADDLIDKINLGAIDSDFYNIMFAEKFGLSKPMTPEQRVELKRLATIVQKQESGSYLEREATKDMLTYMDNLYPKQDVFNTFISLYYASLLSGMSTSTLNILSAGSVKALKPVQDLTNLSLWLKAARKGIEGGKVSDFLAYSPFNDMFYLPGTFMQSASIGTKEFLDVWANGDVDSKFVEQVSSKKISRVNPLERNRYGKHAFKPMNVTAAGTKVSLNPFNYYKYSGRNLSAQDKLMFRTSYEAEMVSIIREKMLDKGLRGKELKKAVIDEYTQRKVDVDAVMEKLDEQITEYEKDTGKQITGRQKKIMLRDVLERNIDPEIVDTAQNIARGRIFTDSRGGILANTATMIGRLSNTNPAMAGLLKPWVPFTRVVGNVAEYMMDTIPVVGQMRANGVSFTSLANKARNYEINTSQMGLPESREYYEQMGRAWFGTVAFLSAAAMLVGTDEEDDIYITGGYAPDKFKRGRENVTPKYTLVINGVKIPYLNIPGLAIPLAAIGNYNDRLNMGDNEDTLGDRLQAATFNTLFLVKDMSFLKGVQDLIDIVTDLTSGETGRTERAGKELYKKYFLTATKPLPQNFNLIDQLEKIYDPTSFSQKDILDITMYGLGLQRWTNNASLDIFGEEVKTLPGSALLPYDHWLGLKGSDDRWKFLSKYNAIPNPVSGYEEIDIINDDDTFEKRTPEKDELIEYTKLAGKYFDEELRSYMSQGGFDEKEGITVKRGGKDVTLVQKEVADLWSIAKRQARTELFEN